MYASINSFCGQIAASRARSLLAYLFDMSRRSLCGFLRFIPQNKFLEAYYGVG
jgi:hypothetical protein